MRRIFLTLLLFCPSLAAFADGMIIPTIASPAHVTIPDQRALICYNNDIERLVIETRFTGAGTNFAWVVPLPAPPLIEAATTGVFPTLQYLFRPEVVHEVTPYYIGILLGLGFACLFWRALRGPWGFARFLILICLLLMLASILLPTLSRASRKAMGSSTSPEMVSVLDRKLVGIYETTTITSSDPRALQNWLRDNGYDITPEAIPIINDYLKEGWVFVASKVHRDADRTDASTPHPLSFTFKTANPVYPMRLTGLNSQSLLVDLYYFGTGGVFAPPFTVESCERRGIEHPLLQKWSDGLPVKTKLTATLSPADMRRDIWLKPTSYHDLKENRLYSRHGAWITAVNWGAGVFTFILVSGCLVAFTRDGRMSQPAWWVGKLALGSLALTGLVYLSLPKIDVTLSRGWPYNRAKTEMYTVRMALEDCDWHNLSEARAGLEKLLSIDTNAVVYGLKNWENPLLGGRIHEEDSPGNYQLSETNNQLQFIGYSGDDGEWIHEALDFPARK